MSFYITAAIFPSILALIFSLFIPLDPLLYWLELRSSKVPIKFSDVRHLHFQQLDYKLITQSYIQPYQADIKVPIIALTDHHQNGGNLPRLTSALITAKNSSINLTWETARKIDLIGPEKSTHQLIQSTSPKIIECFTT
ncbi:flotillin-like FloA family protein [Planctomycetota bacterium]|nr:flotillin-like FloA family protein [Planctomycetota bacterium]